jgi:glycosyltransferase involved in cell wall biosynthesis
LEKGINNFECNIIGDGPLREQLDRVTKKLNLEDRVKILGQRPHNEVIQKMKSSDIFALPSWDEPFGIVFIEAMQIGLPVIGTLNEGISDVIKNRENGVLVEKKNYKELAAAIEFLMKDSNARKTIAKNGYESARQLTWENNVRKNMEIFNYILNNVKR